MNQQQTNKQILSANQSSITKSRIAYIDNLKSLTMVFLVIQHVIATYSGIGVWYYTENKPLDTSSFYFFFFVESFVQAYFMSLFFMISAYFIPSSLARKGAKKFINDRLFRLGVPTLIFVFVVAPILGKIMYPAGTIGLYLYSIISFNFLSWIGIMWFVVALLILSILYVPASPWFTKLAERYSFAINVKNVLLLTAFITILAFVIRLVYPIGKTVLNFQLGYFAAYIVMFCLGIIARQKNLLESITYQKALKWFGAAFVFGTPLWILVVYFGMPNKIFLGSALTGGWNLLALGYALWESFYCVAIIIGLIGIFKTKFNSESPFKKFLAANAFGVYVFHPLIIVPVAIFFKNVDLCPILKFIIVAAIGVPFSFIFTAFIRRIPGLHKVFS